ncbi:isocitrate lyase/phosphoenolpyruvate mutase family protein [Actinoplanes bogorensis]|uniref:Isocitrate lyase/phosphoenolpyruvate mutase family protein n=1 Tax=Paractinoplanes bogorensis TaxID=1610840 RepID=A0ABS5YPP5_9ACTN|nr:isocitrate lyase/phosphoenolpyruvate mutase family protein [Actinoplanes bogorensis]MBU2665424.1 isocitrate lyase/phosphoenolpyruvate mutase family protein [Actinoplanes bogorensis]
MDEMRARFRSLHDAGMFLMPNPWDAGSARILEELGFPALATTSSGLAAALGKADQQVTLDELAAHVRALTTVIAVPLNVDAERCYDDIAETVEALAAAGASGISIEDYDPATGQVETLETGAARVAVAKEACARYGVVLTARAENLLYGHDDLDDTIARLRAYRAAGADVAYAPGLITPQDITRVVAGVPAPINVLALAGTPETAELAELGVRRVSTGGSLAWAAYGALRNAARELLDTGTTTFRAASLAGDEIAAIAARGSAAGGR